MEKSLIKRLLQIYHSEEERFSRSKGLQQFMQDYNIGQAVGAAIRFSPQDKADIRALLRQTEGIDADTTQPEQWDGLSRTASLSLASNEKLTDTTVRDKRVAIKHLPQQSLRLGGNRLTLPPASNLDVDWQWLARHQRHTHVLVVENWEVFDNIHHADMDFSAAGENPLVVFRGSPVYPQDHVIALLEAVRLPVYAFVDFDPAGLALALALPNFQDIIAPPTAVLQTAVAQCANHERYQRQLPATQAVLDAAEHPHIRQLWALLKTAGVALPQEYFVHD